MAYVESLKASDHHHVVGHFGDDGHDVKGSGQSFDLVHQRGPQLIVGAQRVGHGVRIGASQNVEALLRVAHQVPEQELVLGYPLNGFDE